MNTEEYQHTRNLCSLQYKNYDLYTIEHIHTVILIFHPKNVKNSNIVVGYNDLLP